MTQTLLRPPAKPAPPVKTFSRSRGITRAAWKILLYGTGGIGKSSLAAGAPGVVFADIERSTPDLDVERVDNIDNWTDLRAWLNSPDAAQAKTVVIDSGSKAEEWCVQHVLQTIPTEKGQKVDRIESYGFGKGYSHVFEEWLKFLGDLDAHYRAGRNVILIAHDTVGNVPNPTGDDFKRYQPRLQSQSNGNILAKTKEWADHVLFINYDMVVKDGKAKGEGTRTIYVNETPSYMAKNRNLSDTPIVFPKGGTELWDLLSRPRVSAPEL